MLFLFGIIIAYMILEKLLYINKGDYFIIKILKTLSILIGSLLSIYYIFDKSQLNLLFAIIIIYIISTIRKDSLYNEYSKGINYDYFKTDKLLHPFKERYYKFYKNIKNSYTNIINVPNSNDDSKYSLDELYPEKEPEPKENSPEIISFQEQPKVTIEYDEELTQISEGLMDEYWLTNDNTKYKKNEPKQCDSFSKISVPNVTGPP
jgi:hypothetical protein